MYNERMEAEKQMGAPVRQSPAQYVKIPAKYADPKTSPLQVTLEKGKQSMDFNLTD